MLTISDLDRLEAAANQAVVSARRGVTDAQGTGDDELLIARRAQLAAAVAAKEAVQTLSAAKSAEINLGMRRALGL